MIQDLNIKICQWITIFFNNNNKKRIENIFEAKNFMYFLKFSNFKINTNKKEASKLVIFKMEYKVDDLM